MYKHPDVASVAYGINRLETDCNAEANKSAKSIHSMQSTMPAKAIKPAIAIKATGTLMTVITVKKPKREHGRSADTSSAILFGIRFALIVFIAAQTENSGDAACGQRRRFLISSFFFRSHHAEIPCCRCF
ncbi:hypothetical protein [Undibacterium squillarum]|uniref:hypothetical protein n=1 Tax=Undibacterium squillarum TaxID=1131567 RepID=UPI0035AE99C8